MPCYSIDGLVPVVDASAFVDANAVLIGDVWVGPGVYVGPCASLRGDFGRLVLEAGSNVQDNSVLHTDAGIELRVGANVTIGHQVMLHGCTIGDNTLVGIQSVILNGAKIGRNSIVGAGALVTEGKEFPDGVLIVGSPAKVVRELTPEQIERLKWNSAHYVENAARHRSQIKRIA